MAAKRQRRGTIWSNLRWVHPVRSIRGSGTTGLKGKLKYLTYRDDRNINAPKGGRRWIDQGLGGTYREIYENCQQLKSHDRLAWTMMLSPKPRLMALIEEEADRREFLQSLTEDVMEHWFLTRGYANAEYSYVIHDRSTSEEGLQQLHTHVVLPGTVETSAGRERFDNRPSDLREFNELVEDLFEFHMDRQLGLTWRDQWKSIQREDALRKQFQEMQVGDIPPDLSELARRLHALGYTPDRIPEHITDLDAFYAWLEQHESDEPDLDTWFGVER